MKTKRTKKPQRRTMWYTVALVQVIDPATGEVLQRCKGLIARDGITRRMMKDRGYRVGDELKGDMRKGRNYQQWKTAHGLGMLCIEQIERFAEFGHDAHAALKAIQRESGIACDTLQIDASPVVEAVLAAAETVVGKLSMFALRKILPAIKTVSVNEARSLGYDSIDGAQFNEVFNGLCDHILRTYWPELDEMEGRAKIQKWIGENT
jgi:hypothetical protein